MPRSARHKSQTGIYHVMLRGINKQNIFEDDADRMRFIETIVECKEISGFKLLGYCLMRNHIHMLIKEETEPIGQIFKRVGVRYVFWYNHKYNRCGHLFQDRFRSEAVEDDSYFLTVLRYILQNPIKAGLTANPSDYKWSSYNNYIQGNGITDTELALSIFSSNRKRSIEEFAQYINEPNLDKCLDLKDVEIKMSDQDLSNLIRNQFNIEPMSIKNLQVDEQTKILEYLKSLVGVTYQQISNITGFTVYKIFKA